ncbi:MAG: type II and III secretion system protein [Betaproteobacteria bacterium]|nr:MAG: type II and III secretion system protein [Betaproteobacteria bacterium]
MRFGTSAAVALLAGLLSACAQAPVKPAETHLRAGEPRPEGSIPPPVQMAPVLPRPKPSVRPETYSVVVSNVRVQELLFALARDARLNVDISPDITGTVTLNAIDQTLPQLLSRIARQVDLRWEIDGQTLVVMRDTPFLRAYKIDYLSAARNVTMKSTASTLFGGGTGAAAASGPAATGATATIDVKAENNLWDSIVLNVKEILRETDKILPAAATFAAPVQPPPVAPGAGQSATAPGPAAAPISTYHKQQEKVQEFLDQVMAGAKRQVLVEATVAEVQLRNEYQRGIEWQRVPSGTTGFTFSQPALAPPTGFNPNPFLIGYVSTANNFSVTLKLLEQFGDVRVLSSPKLSVMNNQTAILRVTRDIIYFTITPSTQPITFAGSGAGGVTVNASFTTTPNIAAEGFMMAVLPQINETDGVVLNVRPTIRRQVGSARDPNPALQGAATQNDIPLFETREFDSILRLQSGETAVLAGLMQDQVENTDAGIPGIRSIPLIGEALSSRSDLTRKTELVIFLRASVIRDPSADGDFRRFRDQLPGGDFFTKPNPGRIAPPVGPAGEPLR